MLKNKIKELLGDKSIRSLGQDIGVVYPTIHNIVNIDDLSTISIGNMIAIADALNVKLEEMYEVVKYYVVLNDEVIYTSYHKNACVKHINKIFKLEDFADIIRRNLDPIIEYKIIEYNLNTDVKTDVESVIHDVKELNEIQEAIEDYSDMKFYLGLLYDNAEMSINNNDNEVEIFVKLAEKHNFEYEDLAGITDLEEYKTVLSFMIEKINSAVKELQEKYDEKLKGDVKTW